MRRLVIYLSFWFVFGGNTFLIVLILIPHYFGMKIKPVWQLSLNTAWHAGKQTCKQFFQDFHILVKKSWIKWTMHILQNAEWSIGFGEVSLIIRNCCGWESYMKRVCLPKNGKRLPGRLLRTPLDVGLTNHFDVEIS